MTVRVLVVPAIILSCFTVATPAMASAGGASPCIATLASSDPGGMSSTVVTWQNDFLGVGQNAGHYAEFVARTRPPFCPGP
jgi:hypothetical protein